MRAPLDWILPTLLLTACSTSKPLPDGGGTSCAALEQTIAQKLDAAATDTTVTTDPNFALLLETNQGGTFVYTHGNTTATTRYESASTSKWVTAVVLLDLVGAGVLTLETKASSLLPFFTDDAVTLRHLLSFTSGYWDEPLCLNLPNANFADCVQTIVTTNQGKTTPAGSKFDYASTHMQIAGLMAVNAKGAADWSAIFAAFVGKTGLFPTGAYDLPSSANPRLAGGMHWTGNEYMEFLRALVHGTVLDAALRTELFANQRGAATVGNSPSLSGFGEDWAYGLGNWLECPTAKTAGSFDCGAGHRNASPGAYGAYPFIDFDHRYFGLLSRQGALGSYPEGLALFRRVESDVAAWADADCGH